MSYELRRQPSGVMALHHRGYRETMHPGLGPWQEAQELYLAASRLRALLLEPGEAGGRAGRGAGGVVVFDVGLGAAANALAALVCRLELERQGFKPRPLTVVSFENDCGPARFALAHASQLGYLLGHEKGLEALLREGRWEDGEGVCWELRQGDFTQLVFQEPRRADVIFFDPFSPRANPHMWSLATLTGLFNCRRPGATTRLVTYSASFAARAALMLAGFFVGEWLADAGARPGTEAATEISALSAPLGGGWLGRWRRDRLPWPPLTAPADYRRLREALADHPQWSGLEPSATPAAPVAAPGRQRATAARQHRGPARVAEKGTRMPGAKAPGKKRRQSRE